MKWIDGTNGSSGKFSASVDSIGLNRQHIGDSGLLRYVITYGRQSWISAPNLEVAKADAIRLVKRELRRAAKEIATVRKKKRKRAA